MSDYRVKVTVSNARIRRAIENAGFKNVRSVCVYAGINPAAVGKLVNMKESPLKNEGGWKKIVTDLADALGVCPEDLFSESQKTVKLKTNVGFKDVEESSLVSIAAGYINQERIEDLRDNAAVEEIAERQVNEIVSGAVATLTPREQSAINMRFGMDGKGGMTYEQIGDQFGVTTERARQIEQKALRKLRHPGIVEEKHLRECIEDISA